MFLAHAPLLVERSAPICAFRHGSIELFKKHDNHWRTHTWQQNVWTKQQESASALADACKQTSAPQNLP